MEQRPPPPEANFTAQRSREEIQLVLDRVVYLLEWLAENSTLSLPGRHQHAFRTAVEDLVSKLGPRSRRWPQTVWDTGPNDHPNAHEDAGLVGPQLAFKIAVFTRAYQEFLDEAVLRGGKNSALSRHDMEEIVTKIVPWSRRFIKRWLAPLKRALSSGAKLADSLMGIAAPTSKAKIESIKDLAGMAVTSIEATG